MTDRLGPRPEVLDVAPPRAVRRRRWVLVAVVTAALVLVGVAWRVDEAARMRENAALHECRGLVHQATISADLLLTSVAFNLRPSCVRRTARTAARWSP